MEFEKATAKLSEIVEKLDSKGVTLEESIALFEEGVNVSKDCIDILKQARGKITVIRRQMDEIFEQPLDGGEEKSAEGNE